MARNQEMVSLGMEAEKGKEVRGKAAFANKERTEREKPQSLSWPLFFTW